MSKFVIGGLAGLALLVPSVGQTQSQQRTYTVTFDDSYQTSPAGAINNYSYCSFNNAQTSATYHVVTLELAEPSNLSMTMDPQNTEVSALFYYGVFDPNSPSTGCLSNVFHVMTYNAPAGTYSLLIVNQNGVAGTSGYININSTKPFTLSGPKPVPTLTEWAMIGLATGLAGIAGLGLYRRRRAA